MSRTRLLCAAALLVAALASVVHVPEGRLAAAGRPGSARARLLRPGVHLRLPVVERVVLFAAGHLKVENSISWTTPEGATVNLPYRLTLDASAASPSFLLAEVADGDLAAAVRRVFDAARSAGGSGPAVAPPHAAEGEAWRRRLEEALDAMGLVPGSLAFQAPRPRQSPVPGRENEPLESIRASYRGPRHPVLLVGIDSADWTSMGPFMDRGDLPALRALKERGAWGVLRSSVPMLSPLLWTTVVTGKTPDQHGIVDFLAQDPATGRPVPISSRLRRVRALWSILTSVGRPSLTVGWWATWPAERVEGAMISDRLSYSLSEEGAEQAVKDVVYPPSLEPAASKLIVRPEEISYAEVRSIIEIGAEEFARARSSLVSASSWKDPVAHLLRILAATQTYHRIAVERLRASQPPLALVYYEGLDEVNHRFAHYAAPATKWADPEKVGAFSHAVERFYRLQDRLIGELVASVDPGTVVMVISDHGFASGDRRPTDVPPDIEGKPGRWHTMSGVIIAAGPPVRPGRLSRDPRLIDIAPTILALLSLPAAEDMPGRPVAEVVPSGSVPAPALTAIATYEPPAAVPREARAGASSAADAEILAKLTALGYIGAPGDGTVPAGAAETTRPAETPGTVTGHVNAGNVLLAKGKAREAELEFRAALLMARAYVPARLGLAQCLIATGREAEGWESLGLILRDGDDLDATVYLMVSRFYRRQGRAAEGAALFADLPRRDGLEPARLAARASLLRSVGDSQAAERDLRAALSEDPAYPEGLQEMYALLTPRGAYDDLIALLEAGIQTRPGGVVAANLLALTLERAGRLEEAESTLHRSLETSPRDVATLTNLAGILLRKGDATSALPLLARARDVDPSNVGVLVNLVVAEGRAGDLVAARRMFRAAGAAAERSEVLNAMAYACYLNGEMGEAKQLITRSLSRKPDQAEALRLLSAIEEAESRSGAPSSARRPGL